MLKRAAVREGMPLSTLVARIDAERIASPTPCGLAAAIRLWLVSRQVEETLGVSDGRDCP